MPTDNTRIDAALALGLGFIVGAASGAVIALLAASNWLGLL